MKAGREFVQHPAGERQIVWLGRSRGPQRRDV